MVCIYSAFPSIGSPSRRRVKVRSSPVERTWGTFGGLVIAILSMVCIRMYIERILGAGYRTVYVLYLWYVYQRAQQPSRTHLRNGPFGGLVIGWPSKYVVLHLYVWARINRPFFLPAHLHCPHCCNTIARLLGNIQPPTRTPLCAPYTIQHW